MSRLGSFVAIAVLAAGAGAGGYWAGQRDLSVPAVVQIISANIVSALGAEQTPTVVGSSASDPVIYYRHPDGEPVYSSTPKQTPDGRDFVAVLASEDVSFEARPKDEAKGAEATAPGERKILYYRNPMGLPDTSPTPKKDSMGMAYIPVFEGETKDGATVKLSTGKLQRTGVKTVPATRGAIVRPVRIPGTVTFDERRVSVVSIRTEAFLEKVADITTGETIKKGRPLVSFYAKEIAAAGALYAADLRSGSSKATASGSLQRLTNLGVPAEAIVEIEKTRKVPISVTLVAPRNGVVLERRAVDGMMAEAGETLFRIADASTVWVMADVPEYELSSVRVGDKATVRIRSLSGKVFEGKVGLIYPEIQGQTRTARIRIELANPNGLLLANMYADVEIATGGNDPAVTVPDSAVIDTGDRQVVIVDKGEGSFEPRDVKVGMRGEGMAEITQGITEGEKVVVSANFLIDAESNLKAALSALTPAEAQP
ncbi:efflux RND transporter periplasmic adaptor subunit [Mesorhizobium mediterraneum]|uniref:Efflux transporter periplasmic adaptor subunit n=1 Tax=Mesorhizobium mediterraneum TaxID=43617 RepID=A0AB36R9G3_9HYPH|nr:MULTISPECIES: efflux RND transporter periplasmic adaptor subunit [Mesorhizobium]PAQ01214.1 efflux transporter periplasmic adaptor subunit [Mesorhizobium mediterraneum]RUU43936.1 efflux RND transporter periplasmic adaptor subunit [Mesorhizobium sp. M6A.T.Ce.TU.002.03.1.1]RUU96972.1 efflux RND transporter periplasmic adaptor subunit [Mesorhizobium sp. M6A.T.Cr.TU.017.01.1.1]RWN34978.1 MAG: efflux RND transporter periplasmic adaptor subunit [Mesorhizobium sp.]RWO96026.1 MAG: efflux RND transpo